MATSLNGARRVPAMARALVVVGALLGAGWGADVVAHACAPPATAMARVELLLAVERNDGRPVTPDEWEAFLAEEVTPRFPDGLTVIDADGQWRGPDGIISRSASRILLIWYAPSAASERAIEDIRARYKARFEQLSVMRVDGEDCVGF